MFTNILDSGVRRNDGIRDLGEFLREGGNEQYGEA